MGKGREPPLRRAGGLAAASQPLPPANAPHPGTPRTPSGVPPGSGGCRGSTLEPGGRWPCQGTVGVLQPP